MVVANMSLNGSGVYSPNTAGQPVQSGTIITSTAFNALIDDMSTALSTALYKDGQQVATANQPMGGFKHTNIGDAVARTQYAAAGQVQDGALEYLTGVSGTNTILASVSPTPSAYAAGQRFTFIVGTTNTGAVTLNVSSLGAKSVKKKMSGGKVAITAGDLVSGLSAEVFYDGTDFILETARTYSHGADIASAGTINLDTSTGDLIDVTGTTSITAITLAEGEERTVRFTGALTLTHGASLVLPGSVNINTTAGDFAVFRGYASGVVRVVSYTSIAGYVPVTGQCRLARASSTSLILTPLNGNLLTVNGRQCSIPDAGVTSGIGAPAASNTTYYIYAIATAGVITSLEASATAWSISTTAGNKGVPIKTGDDTRTLVGIARGNGSTQWADTAAERYVLNYWNRRDIAAQGAFTALRSTSGGAYSEINSEIRASFLTWADEAVDIQMHGIAYNDTAGTITFTGLGVDSATVATYEVQYVQQSTIGSTGTSSLQSRATLSEGQHFATLLGKVGGSTGNWYTGSTVGVMVRG